MRDQLIILAIIIAAFWLFRRFFPARHKPHLSSPNAYGAHHEGPYQAASIHAYEGACEAAKDLQGKRYLSAEAPVIPLENCTAGKCHCVYRHHDDRRSGEKDRRKRHLQDDGSLEPPDQGNRRFSPGRRATDLAVA